MPVDGIYRSGKELIMSTAIAIGLADDTCGMRATLMNPQNALMNPSGSMVGREQKEGMSDLKDLMREMIAALHQLADRAAPIDIGGKDIRPSDMAAHFNPQMDQDINIYTGRGDDMVMIV